MNKKFSSFLTIAFLMFFQVVIGQSTSVTGVITDNTGSPLPGVNVVEKGTSNGTSTDFDGNYTINVDVNATLVISSLGFATKEVAVNGKTTLNISISEDASQLDEVVVTAFGVERKTKSLGYAVSEVKGDKFTESRTANLGSALTGKVAGVNVTSPSTGPAGTSRVVIRGGSSLTGNDQPLYVVNGIPIDNTNLGSASLWGGSDGGDGLSSINPDDIESLSVLKGNSAAALYGSRAANGVIIITTKTGKARKGVGVSFNSNFQFESVIDRTDFQKEYGYGTDGEKPINQEGAIANGNLSWGARLDGSQVIQFDGVERPYSDVGDGLKDFYRTGYLATNTLALSGGDEMHTYRFSASNLNNESIVPNSGFDRNLFSVNIGGNYGKLVANISAQYSKEKRKNTPRVSDTPGNANFTAFTKNSAISFESLKGPTDKLGANDDGTELLHQGNPYAQNPYWATYQWNREDIKDRILGNASLTYNFTDWLYVQGRLGIDYASSSQENLEAYGTAFKPLGGLNLTNRIVRENNSDLLIGIDQEFGDFGIDVLLGGNIRRSSDESTRVGGDNLNIPFFNSVTNVANQSYTYTFAEVGTNSIFGQVNFSYLDYLFLNFTGREDTFSTLSSENNKLFYPSAGLSFIPSQAFNFPEVISYAKIRGSWAQVGGGAPNPYALNLTYALDSYNHQGATLGRINTNTIPNSALQPYTSTEVEFGIEMRFFQNRLGFDVTYYNRKTENDILNTGVSRTSGFENTTINIGELENNGIEVLVTGVPVRTENFQWSTDFNMAYNHSEAINLGTDAEGNPIDFLNRESARTLQESIRHYVGQPLGLIAGYKHAEINGQKVYTADGFPVRSAEYEILGEGRQPFSAGLTNSFRYKNFSLNFLIDMRSGGSLMSGTNVLAYSMGLHKETLVGRETGITVSGVDVDGNPLSVNISSQNMDNYYGEVSKITENFVYDASYGKLRELSIGYSFKQDFLDKTPFAGLDVSLVGRNLFLLWSSVPNIDPESNFSSGSGTEGLEYFSLPSTRSYGLNISARF